jgi:hypothetical protein
MQKLFPQICHRVPVTHAPTFMSLCVTAFEDYSALRVRGSQIMETQSTDSASGSGYKSDKSTPHN